MLSFIKHYELKNLKLKLMLLYFLNLSDIIFTLILIQAELVMEANPMMAIVLSSGTMTFLVKIILPALLFIYLYIRLKSADEKMTKLTNVALLVLLSFYLLINFFHLLWLIILPFFL